MNERERIEAMTGTDELIPNFDMVRWLNAWTFPKIPVTPQEEEAWRERGA